MNNKKTYTVWARVGMTGNLTKEELDLLNKKGKTSEDFEKVDNIFKNKFFRDGETYFPEEDDNNKKYISQEWY